MTKEKDWADERADAVVNSIGYREDPGAAIAEALQQVADECVDVLWGRVGREEYGHAKAAVTLDIEAIRARFPRCSDGK